MSYYIINLGTNKGNRRLNLSRAVKAVADCFGPFEVSHVIESKSWGYDSPNKFLNICMMFQSDMQPGDVLARLQDIEKRIGGGESHRNPDGSYADRIIDIDIVAADDMTVNTGSLVIPHPRLAERSFFLEPMAEIAAGWRHPATGLTPGEMLAQLPANTDDDEK